MNSQLLDELASVRFEVCSLPDGDPDEVDGRTLLQQWKSGAAVPVAMTGPDGSREIYVAGAHVRIAATPGAAKHAEGTGAPAPVRRLYAAHVALHREYPLQSTVTRYRKDTDGLWTPCERNPEELDYENRWLQDELHRSIAGLRPLLADMAEKGFTFGLPGNPSRHHAQSTPQEILAPVLTEGRQDHADPLWVTRVAQDSLRTREIARHTTQCAKRALRALDELDPVRCTSDAVTEVARLAADVGRRIRVASDALTHEDLPRVDLLWASLDLTEWTLQLELSRANSPTQGLNTEWLAGWTLLDAIDLGQLVVCQSGSGAPDVIPRRGTGDKPTALISSCCTDESRGIFLSEPLRDDTNEVEQMWLDLDCYDVRLEIEGSGRPERPSLFEDLCTEFRQVLPRPMTTPAARLRPPDETAPDATPEP